MKVNGNDNNKKIIEVTDATSERIKKHNTEKPKATSKNSNNDTVDVSTAAAIRDEASADKVISERRAKVEFIKSQVQAGSYKIPASEILAEHVAKGIIDEIEILTSGSEI